MLKALLVGAFDAIASQACTTSAIGIWKDAPTVFLHSFSVGMRSGLTYCLGGPNELPTGFPSPGDRDRDHLDGFRGLFGDRMDSGFLIAV